MPYILELQPEEQLITDIDYQVSPKVPRFRFAITNQAVFIPATKFVVAGDPTYFKRVSLADIQEIRVDPIKPYGYYVTAVLLALLGLFLLGTIFLPSGGLNPSRISWGLMGWGLALLVGGILLPLAGRGRYKLFVSMGKEKYEWVPPMVVDSDSKNHVKELLNKIIAAGNTVGISVHDSRPQLSMPLPPK